MQAFVISRRDSHWNATENVAKVIRRHIFKVSFFFSVSLLNFFALLYQNNKNLTFQSSSDYKY